MQDEANSKPVLNEQQSPGSFFDFVCEDTTQKDIANTSVIDNSVEADGNENSSQEDQKSQLEMPHEARRALVYLLRHGVVIANENSQIFADICKYQKIVRRHLSETYLQLTIDQKNGIMFIRGLSEEEEAEINLEEHVSLIVKRTLSLYDTLVLLVLRKHYQEREVSGEQKVIIDIDRLESFLTPFLPITNNSRTDRKKLNASLQKFMSKKLLNVCRGDEDRFEVTPVIRYVVNAEFLETLLADYYKLAKEYGATVEDDKNEA